MKPRVHQSPETALEAALDAIELDDAIEGTDGEYSRVTRWPSCGVVVSGVG